MPAQAIKSDLNSQAHYNNVAKERDGGLAFSPFENVVAVGMFVIYVMNIVFMSVKIKLNFTNKCPGSEP